MGTAQAMVWAMELRDCEPLQRLAALYFAACAGSTGDNSMRCEISIAVFAEWAGCDREFAEAAIVSLEDFEGVEVYRDQDAGFEVTLRFVGERSRTKIPVESLLKTVDCWLYVIATANAVKVGITGNPENRFRGFRTAIPHPFEVKLLARGDRRSIIKAESYCHQTMRDHRITGEWFDLPISEVLRIARQILAESGIEEMPLK